MRKFIFSLFLMLVCNSAVRADAYYCMLFSYDSKPVPIPVLCHIWGEFVHVDDKGKLVEDIVFSWGPDNVSYLDKTRPGVNNSYHVLDYAKKEKNDVRMWGPFECNEHFYKKAKNQTAQDGKYKFIDCFNRKTNQNCIHRLSDLAGPHKTGIYWGWWAGESVYKHYKKQGVIRPTTNSDTIYSMLELHRYEIKRMVK